MFRFFVGIDDNTGIGRVFLSQFRESLLRFAAVRALVQIEKVICCMEIPPYGSDQRGRSPPVNS